MGLKVSEQTAKKSYKCVKSTLKAIRNDKKKEVNIKANIKQKKDVFSNIEEAKIFYEGMIEKFKKLGWNRVIDAVFNTPIDYELWSRFEKYGEIKDGGFYCVKLKICEVKNANVPSYVLQKRHIPLTIKTKMSSGQELEVIFFNFYPNITKSFVVGRELVCKGKITFSSSGKMKMVHPSFSSEIQEFNSGFSITRLSFFEENGEEIEDSEICKVVPVYRLTEGVKQGQIISAIRKIFNNRDYDFSFLDNFDEILKKRCFYNDIPTAKESLMALHFPQKVSDITDIRYCEKLSFLELLSFYYELAKAREGRKEENGFSVCGNGNLQEKILKNLPFSLTEEQNKCLKEIFEDQKQSKKMFRLLQGDVGSGKTIVAVLSALNAVESGYKAVFMAPTAILAKQHFENLQKYCFGTGIQVELLIGETKQKARKDILTRMKLGQVDILVGTHTLFQSKIELPYNVGLFVIDEQHNFGVEQRVNLISKCGRADILMMSATPIPRTMIMGLYGDVKVSRINSKPSNRLPIDTKVLSFDEKYSSLVAGLKRQVEKGEKIYWVCPLVEESEKLDYIDVNTRFAELKSIIGEDKIGILHGKMTQERKDNAMMEFKNGKYNLLVSTTVIEVGVDVPEATIIVIENAEKFGLAQLHQLRGRVGRGAKQSYCFLLYGKNVSEIGKKRLEILKKYNNGFEIAEFDLKIRGGGNLLDKQQSGFRTMKFVNFTRDKWIVELLNEMKLQDIDADKVEKVVSVFFPSIKESSSKMFDC